MEVTITLDDKLVPAMEALAAMKGVRDIPVLVETLVLAWAQSAARNVTPLHVRMEDLDARLMEATRLLVTHGQELREVAQSVAELRRGQV